MRSEAMGIVGAEEDLTCNIEISVTIPKEYLSQHIF